MALKWQCCSSLKWLKITTFWAKNHSKMVEIQKKIKSFNSTQKNHGVQKMSIFLWKMNSQRKVELGEEYPSGPFDGRGYSLKILNINFYNNFIWGWTFLTRVSHLQEPFSELKYCGLINKCFISWKNYQFNRSINKPSLNPFLQHNYKTYSTIINPCDRF